VVVVAFQVLADADTFASALGGVFGLIIYCVLGFFALAVALFLLGKILVLLGWAMGRLHATTKSKAVKPARVKPARQVQRLSEVATFTSVVMQLQANNVLTATEKLALIGNQYVMSIDRLAASGRLTPQVEAEFRDFAEASAVEMTGLTANFNNSLQHLVNSYPRRRKLLSRRIKPQGPPS